MRWEKAELLVGEIGYTETFKDSLLNVYTVTDFSNLRKISHPVQYKKEKLVYDGGWGFIRAGFGIFDMTRKKESGIILLEGKAVTNNFVSAFFKVRDYVRTPIDLNGFYPIFFEQHLRENRYKKDTWIIYDHINGILYTNRTKDSTDYNVSPFTHNYLSLLYYLRSVEFAPGDTFSVNCFVHGKDYPIFFRALEREEVKVKAGIFQCIKVEPKLVGEGKGFTKRDKMYLWFTDNNDHILVKAKSKIAIGWISAHLIAIKRE
ncbi:MAG: DUF3108 domain-containing protein [Chitinispirillia bacterium]